ncbi:MAG: hypothetical protein Q4F83_02665 [Eubacteriales bacterium]|nr:hypothetical protein [Eubacteriales bacterium]
MPVQELTGRWTISGTQTASHISCSERQVGMKKIILAILDVLSLIADRIFDEND